MSELSEFAFFLWTEYNSKGKRIPFEHTEKFMRLQGKTENEIKKAKQKFDEQTKKQNKKADEKELKNKEKIKKLEEKLWTKYNSKGEKPPIDLIRRWSFLQGKSKEEVMKMDYHTLEKRKLPWDDEATDEDRAYWQLPKPKDGHEHLKMKDHVDRWKGVNRINQETTLEEVLTNKVFINPDPCFTIRRSNIGYIWDFNQSGQQ